MVIDQNHGFMKSRRELDNTMTERQRWNPSGENEAKLNVDGAFLGPGQAGCNIVLRDHKGEVIYASCCQVQQCQDAT
jgi:hypothetical protein